MGITDHDVAELKDLQDQAAWILTTKKSHPARGGFLAIVPDTVDAASANTWFVRAKSIVARVLGRDAEAYRSLEGVGNPTQHHGFARAASYVDAAMQEARSLKARTPSVAPFTRPGDSQTVFLVHGRDDAAKLTVARFLEKMGVEVVILHEQANRGGTIIEKFEEHASRSAFAVVLLTADDLGKLDRDDFELRPRVTAHAG
ncbi:MAG: nucleotide-binding protein [Myxococcales bacterium]|nr:nucleotide-binding protein [Myxococcales bacterium]